jgi:RNA polymerase-binding transcription factor DksA
MAKKSTKNVPAKKVGKTIKGKGADSKKKTAKSPAARTVKKSVPKLKTAVKKKAVAKKIEKKLIKPKLTLKKDKEKISMAKADDKKSTVKKSAKKTASEPVVHLAPKPVKHIKGYSKQDLEHFRKIILDKRDEIIEQLQNLKEQMLDPTTGEYINENSPYSLHMAEQGTDAMEREKTFLYAQRENKFLGYLEDALKRIDAGTYGICVECIDEPQYLCETCPLIPKPRLEAVPHSQLCLPIKQRQEKYK